MSGVKSISVSFLYLIYLLISAAVISFPTDMQVLRFWYLSVETK
jgi:hypothetical protein